MLTPRLAAALALLLAPAVSRAALDPHLPADTRSYVSVNVKQVLGSPLVKKYALGPAKDALKQIDGVNELLTELGFDPFKDLDRVIVSSPGAKEADRGLIILYGAFDAAKIDKKAA